MRFLSVQLGLNLQRLRAVETYRSPGPFGVFAEEKSVRPRVWHFAGKPANDNQPRGPRATIWQEEY